MKLRYLFSLTVVAAMSAQTLAHAYTGAKAAGEEAGRVITQARAALGGEAALGQVKSIGFSGTNRHLTPEGEKAGEVRFVFSTSHDAENADVVMFRREKAPRDGESGDVVVVRRGPVGGAEAGEPAEAKKRVFKIETTGPMMARRPMVGGPEFFHAVFSPMFAKHATYAGEETVEGVRYNVLALGASRLYFDANTNLPAMMKSKGIGHVMVMAEPADAEGGQEKRVIIRSHGEHKAPEGAESAEVIVRFGDYRPAGDLVLPYRITKTINGELASDVEVREYEFNVPIKHEKLHHP